jgi:hypothetical protein
MIRSPLSANGISNLTNAIGKAPTVGFIWTDETVGYSIKDALRMRNA